jgi:hypothetical protein
MMNEEQKAVYTEAGHWVRLGNLAIWGSAAVFFPMTLAPAYLALTTNFPRACLAPASILIGIYWVYLDYRYSKSVNLAREILVDIESSIAAPRLRMYSGQAQFLKNHLDVTTLLGFYVFFLIAFWVLLYVFPIAPIAPLR